MLVERVDASNQLIIDVELDEKPEADGVERARDDVLIVRPRRRMAQELQVIVCFESLVTHEEIPVLSFLCLLKHTRNLINIAILVG